MSFIDQQRKTIIEENNTAQEDFLNILEHLNPAASEITVREPLSGDLDLDILKKCNFTNITSLVFSAGNLTSIKNIPEGITRLVCAENYLIDLSLLPKSLVELDVHHNAIKSIVQFPEYLKELNLSENQLYTIENLPAGLEVLRCSNNQLHILNLSGIENLRVLHCSNNPRLIIENYPDTLQDVDMENDVATQIKRVREEINDNRRQEDSCESRANYTECLYTYFELKQSYQNAVLKTRRSVFRASPSKKIARKKLADLKPKCIECSRPVGTIFKNDGRTYIAKCGDTDKPCSLDIQLFAGEYDTVISMLEYYQRLIEMIKQQIVVDKVEVLFNYVSEKEGVEIFKNNIDFYTKEKVHLTTLQKEYENLYFSDEREEKVQLKIKKIKEIQERIKELYQKSLEDPQIIQDAMRVYVQELAPEMENLQNIQYDSRELIPIEKQYKLYQTPYRIQNLEYTFGEFPKVIKFRVKTNKV